MTSDKVPDNKGITFLFQQQNQIRITWGYIEDKKSNRSVRGYISAVEFDYPENDMPKVIVTCLEGGLHFDRVSGIFGASFFNKKPSGVTAYGKPIINFQNLTVEEIIIRFSKDAQLATPIVSEEFKDIKLDKHSIQILPSGMSPHQFFAELAKKYDAYYKVMLNPSTGKDTIIFLSKSEFNSKLVMDDQVILSYKTPGTLVKSVKLRGEFTAMPGSAKVGVDDSGQAIGVGTKDPVSVGFVDARADLIDTDPTGNNPIASAKGAKKALGQRALVGTVDNSPEMNDVKQVERQAAAKAQCQIGNIVTIDLTTIGYSKLRPGAWYVGGLGKRYSGAYYFREVTHTIDANGGYTCTMSGSNSSDFGGIGKSTDGYTKTQAPKQDVTVGLADTFIPKKIPSASNSTKETAVETYHKIQENK
jgi:hypothetical protein